MKRSEKLRIPAAVGFAVAILALHLSAAEDVLLITGARVLDTVEGRYENPAGVLIRGGRIQALYKTLPAALPPETRKSDLSGATLVPGFGDMAAPGPPTSDLDVDYHYQMSLAYGVTMHRTLDVPAAWAAAQQKRIQAGEVLGPRLWISGRGIDQWPSAQPWLYQVRDAGDAGREVRRQARAGAQWIAGFDNTTPELYRAIRTTADAAKLRVSGRPGATSMLQLAELGVDSIDGLAFPLQPRQKPADDVVPRPADLAAHLAGADASWVEAPERDLRALIGLLARRRRAVVPLLGAQFPRAFPEEAGHDPLLDLLPDSRKQLLFTEMSLVASADTERAKRAWDARIAFVASLLRAGGLVATGTGFERSNFPAPGIGIHQELGWLVRAGLTPAEAIRAATVNCAELVGAQKSAGQIAAGFNADLFVVDGDPLARIDDLQKIRAVVRGGEVLERNALLSAARRAIVADRPRK